MSNFWQKLAKPFTVLAPMEDVTDFVFREIICDLAKPDVIFTEFTSSDGLCSSKGYEYSIKKLLYSKKQRPVVAQIWGSNPNLLYNATHIVKDLKFDGVDINMGCPDRGVIKKEAGSALIQNKQLTGEIISAVREGAGNMAVSVKTRIGFDSIVTEDWIRFLLEQKIDALIIHGRTARGKSKIPADWDEIAKAVLLKDKISPKTIIIGNGDVKSYAEVVEKHQKYGVDGVMIGRGIFADPWVFDKSPTPKVHSPQDKINILLKHTKLFCEKNTILTSEYETPSTLGRGNLSEDFSKSCYKNFDALKKFFKMYVNNFNGADKIRQQLMECNNFAEVQKVVDLNSCAIKKG